MNHEALLLVGKNKIFPLLLGSLNIIILELGDLAKCRIFNLPMFTINKDMLVANVGSEARWLTGHS